MAEELGVDLRRLTYERSDTGMLTTARHARGAVAFFVVHHGGTNAGFSPDGKPLFYDVMLPVYAGPRRRGSRLTSSRAWETQRGTVPDHLVLTAGGAVGLYVEDPAEGAIVSVWTDRAGRVRWK